MNQTSPIDTQDDFDLWIAATHLIECKSFASPLLVWTLLRSNVAVAVGGRLSVNTNAAYIG